MPRRRRAQQIADGVDGVPMLADHLADIALPELKAKGDLLWSFQPGQDHLIGKLDQLTDDIFEKLFHARCCRPAKQRGASRACGEVRDSRQAGRVGQVGLVGLVGPRVLSADPPAYAATGAALPASALARRSRLRTVSEGWAPWDIQ